ncbi:MAG: helix-turn-helix transcriptional regulator [Pseudomonadota bacterium]
MTDTPATKLSLTEALIAHLLRESAPAPLFGLELVRRSSSGDLKLKKGTIYVTLERMEKKGLVTSELETSPPPHFKEGDFYIPRRMYRLTPAGEQALIALEQAVARIPGFLVRS